MPDETINKYDRLYGGVIDIALSTKPSTIRIVQALTGRAESYIIQTCRTEHGDYVFIEYADESGLTRIALPPKVTGLIAAHRNSLTKRNRSRSSRATMQARMDAGEWKGFKKK
jgi:hypothetical protein